MAKLTSSLSPDGPDRHHEAKRRRQAALDAAFDQSTRPYAVVPSNGEDQEYASPITNFTKGLAHNEQGLLAQACDYSNFRNFLNGRGLTFNQPVRDPDSTVTGDLGEPTPYVTLNGKPYSFRTYESPRAGLQYDNEGPDPAGVAIAPAPKLGKSELCAEMAEVYAMALVRDVKFKDLANTRTKLSAIPGQPTVGALLGQLQSLSWFDYTNATSGSFPEISGSALTQHEADRRKTQRLDGAAPTTNQLFRGSSAGVDQGPYLSQFMLIGGKDDIKGGKIPFGAQQIDQHVLPEKDNLDYMVTWGEFLDVQNGRNMKGAVSHESKRRPITTPRDLATFVHIDQLYQAYFNACLLMFDYGVPFNSGFPEAMKDKLEIGRASFATFGGPHILSLLTEVASRALRAVRRQKFQVHLRCRPEALAGKLALAANRMPASLEKDMGPEAAHDLIWMLNELRRDCPELLKWVSDHNNAQANNRPYTVGSVPYDPTKKGDGENFLLPMAFPEGSPMHAAYGAGHATVAGACVTMLKAFFEMNDDTGMAPRLWSDVIANNDTGSPDLFESDGKQLVPWNGDASQVTLEGELNKLAANVSIGRNFAGVHFHTDYYDSVRMGERIAVGILQEQATAYDEKVCFDLTSFDGDQLQVMTGGAGDDAKIVVGSRDNPARVKDWWTRHYQEFDQAPSFVAVG